MRYIRIQCSVEWCTASDTCLESLLLLNYTYHRDGALLLELLYQLNTNVSNVACDQTVTVAGGRSKHVRPIKQPGTIGLVHGEAV